MVGHDHWSLDTAANDPTDYTHMIVPNCWIMMGDRGYEELCIVWRYDDGGEDLLKALRVKHMLHSQKLSFRTHAGSDTQLVRWILSARPSAVV